MSSVESVAVVGSGPAGIAAAAALLRRGHSVTLFERNPTNLSDLTRVARDTARTITDPEALRAKFARQSAERSKSGVPAKTLFGSRHVFLEQDPFLNTSSLPIFRAGVVGGLSEIWGANIPRYEKNDFVGWPITEHDLTPGYLEAEELFALCDRTPPAPLFQELLRRWTTRRPEFEYGVSSLALTHLSGSMCTRCGFCLFGCPEDIIYSSRHTLERLKSDSRFHLHQGEEVLRFSPNGQNSVDVVARDSKDGAVHHRTFRALILAAGPLGTAMIVMRSLGLSEITLKDSAYFLIPALAYHSGESSTDFTLSQLYLRTSAAYLLAYGWSDLVESRLPTFLRPLGRSLLARRFLLFQGYLHSEDSGTLLLRKNEAERFVLQPITNPRTNARIGETFRTLLKHHNELGLLPLFSQTPHVGSGYHFGASFPMTEAPGALTTDRFGFLRDAGPVQIADASVFPTLPPPNPTLTVMANACRIVQEVFG